MAKTHLATDCDVIVPQYLGRLTEIERFEVVAQEANAHLIEVILTDNMENSIERFLHRDSDADPWHGAVKALVENTGGPSLLAEMHDRLGDVRNARPAIVIPSVYGSTDQTYNRSFPRLIADSTLPVPPHTCGRSASRVWLYLWRTQTFGST